MIKIHFYIRYNTRFGESLQLSGNIPQLGNFDPGSAVTMNYLNEEFWTYLLEFNGSPADLSDGIQYKYLFKDTKGRITEEWDDGKTIDIKKITAEQIHLVDTWNFAGQYENAFFTSPFCDVLLPVTASPVKPAPYHGNTHIFKVKAPLLKKDEVMAMLGGTKALGQWNTARPVWMSREGNWWTTKVNLSGVVMPVAYKYAVYHAKTRKFIRYEDGDNRLLHNYADKKRLTVLHDGFVHLVHNDWRGAGVNIPVFSLRSNKSLGTGEFTDIRLLVDWAKKTGMRMIQLLPVNDTTATGTWKDSYPYNAVSAFALHPLYLNVEAVARREDAPLLKSLEKKRKQLNRLAEVDYEEVMRYKWGIIKQLYRVQKKAFFESEEYRQFMKDNRHWLVPYAAYSYLRDKHHALNFPEWGAYSSYDENAVTALSDPGQKHFDGIGIYYFTQYHLHRQLTDATAYAHANGIIVKGDIPIGVNRDSCDVWMEPELFHTDMQAGAPPDDFAVKGQNWGFPTYNWEQMQKNGYEWWQRRFKQMSRYFDAFRIDHLLGFFRIWSIPDHAVEGVMGHFVPAIPMALETFAERGIVFDYHRFCEPFITDAVLDELWGEDQDGIRDFLELRQDGSYRLKPSFSTQRKVASHFSSRESNEENTRIRLVLYDLISNVILFEEEGSQQRQFHFRIDMENTVSFRHLDGYMQRLLKDMYIDYFFHKQEDTWATAAMQKLPSLKKSTRMLICGEDLGMVPRCVPEIMRQLGMLSLEIQRMPKQEGVEFFNPVHAPRLSVVTPSTHDMSTIRAWWEEDREATQRFFNNEMQHPGIAPYYCEPWINKAIIIRHLYSPAMWSVFLLQDLMGIDGKLRRQYPAEERINVPAVPRYYWRYRMHITLEQLLQEDDFNNELMSYIHSSGRGNGWV
ncbi:MAG: 4-alpha-glucanotransferase [Chitinophagaceae bacterium]|nr:4-alpha-glucanotransferase [Chitinophagaceae bacterium]